MYLLRLVLHFRLAKFALARSSHFYLFVPNSKNDAGSSGSLSTNEFHKDYSSTFQEIVSSKEFVLVVLQGASFFTIE